MGCVGGEWDCEGGALEAGAQLWAHRWERRWIGSWWCQWLSSWWGITRHWFVRTEDHLVFYPLLSLVTFTPSIALDFILLSYFRSHSPHPSWNPCHHFFGLSRWNNIPRITQWRSSTGLGLLPSASPPLTTSARGRGAPQLRAKWRVHLGLPHMLTPLSGHVVYLLLPPSWVGNNRIYSQGCDEG